MRRVILVRIVYSIPTGKNNWYKEVLEAATRQDQTNETSDNLSTVGP